MNTNHLLTVITVLMLTLAGCSSDNSQPEATPLSVTGSSIEENSVIEADAVTSITLTFSEDIEVVNPSHSVIVNESASRRTPLEEGHAAGKTWTIPVSLDFDSHYTLTVTGTTVKAKASGIFAKPYTLKFSTAPRQKPDAVSSEIDPLVNPNATAMAKKVHEFLKSTYGIKILSGAMANVNNNNDFAGWIDKMSGKYPAITFYDLIHLPESGQNWIDYSDISPAKAQWDANGLVGYGWHWRVPMKEGDSDLQYTADANFDIEQALTPGTWQNKVVEEDVEKAASILKKLQDNNIAVLWRPLHEAAGDYEWGAWFWWGKQGPEKTKRLWIWLYDKLTNQYGLNNLIWVWTVQLYREGKMAPMSDLQAAYPGDDYVDIVGPDVYNKTHDASPEFFNAVYTLVKGHKIVAMPECGMLPTPEASINDGAPWSYVMLWYSYDQHKKGEVNDDFGNTPAYLKEWMTSPYIITRDQMPNLK